MKLLAGALFIGGLWISLEKMQKDLFSLKPRKSWFTFGPQGPSTVAAPRSNGGYNARRMTESTLHRRPISIIPVYNEVENLRDSREPSPSPSTDGSSSRWYSSTTVHGRFHAARRDHRDDPRFRVVHFIQNYGQTAAMKAGIHHANHEVNVSMDADPQNDPADIPSMLDKLDDYDLVVAGESDVKTTSFFGRSPLRPPTGLSPAPRAFASMTTAAR